MAKAKYFFNHHYGTSARGAGGDATCHRKGVSACIHVETMQSHPHYTVQTYTDVLFFTHKQHRKVSASHRCSRTGSLDHTFASEQ